MLSRVGWQEELPASKPAFLLVRRKRSWDEIRDKGYILKYCGRKHAFHNPSARNKIPTYTNAVPYLEAKSQSPNFPHCVLSRSFSQLTCVQHWPLSWQINQFNIFCIYFFFAWTATSTLCAFLSSPLRVNNSAKRMLICFLFYHADNIRKAAHDMKLPTTPPQF